MNPQHQRKSKLQIQKVAERSLNSSQDWLASSRDYDSSTLFNILVLAALERSSVEDLSHHIMEMNDGPSPDTVMRSLKQKYNGLNQTIISNHVSEILQKQIIQLPLFKMRGKPKAIIAIDLHDEEYYGKNLEDQSKNRLVFYTGHHGKSKQSLRYATLSIVSMNNMFHQPLTIGFGVVHVGKTMEEIVRDLINQINIPIKIDRILLDGSFATVDVLKYLDSENFKWIARGRYSSKKDYPGELDDDWFPYLLKNEYPVAGYLLEQKKPDGDTETILLLTAKLWTPTPEKTKEIYRKRFRIENNYRHARVVKIRTSTRNIQLRWIMWAISHFLELFWHLIRYVHEIQDMDDYLCRQKRENRVMIMLLELQFLQLQYHCSGCACVKRG
ncbi:MAG: transposase [Candidatus Heimdallarchaeota archaeon]